MHADIFGVAIKRTEPGSFQWGLMTGQGATGTNLNPGISF